MMNSKKHEKGVLQSPKWSKVFSFTFEWKIDRFFADCKKLGDYYKSPVFPIDYPNTSTKWYLYVYPKGEKQESKDYVSLYLWYFSDSKTKVSVDLQVSIVNEKNGIKSKDTALFKGQTFGFGWRHFRRQDIVKDPENGILIDDSLAILCKVQFPIPDQDITKNIHNNYDECPSKSEIGFVDYEELLEKESFTDVTFNIQGEKIKTHKAILSHSSPVFKALFKQEMQEKALLTVSKVDVTDIDYNVMKELFRFIYSRKVKNIEEIAIQLLIAADRYKVIELKTLCEKTLYNKVTIDNAIKYLKLAELCDTIHLKRLVIKFIADNYKHIVKKTEFTDLDKSVMHQIIMTLVEKD